MLYVGKVHYRCRSRQGTAKFPSTSYDGALKKVTSFWPRAGCAITSREVVQRGVGAGAPDREPHEHPLGRFKRRHRRRVRARRR